MDLQGRPTVWILLSGGAGGNAQMRALTQALGWPATEKRLAYNVLNHLPTALLGASLASVDKRRSSPLEPPWPDLVVGASRRSAPVALWIRKQSGERTRLVHLLHTQAPLAWFDLVITTPQYRLPQRHNVLHNMAPLNHVAADRIEQGARRWTARLQHLPRPWIALLVGGDSSSYELDVATAVRLARESSLYARSCGGSLLVSTSPRTSLSVVEALCSAIDSPAYVYRWKPDDAENPYLGFLALADEFIVTADSASQTVEACATGKPVAIFEWTQRSRPVAAILGATRPRRNGSAVRDSRVNSRLYERMIEWGLLKPARDFDAYHRALRESGFTYRFGSEPARLPAASFDDLPRAVARVRELMGLDTGNATAGRESAA